ncbi:MAG: ABC-F family ATP-binding cassette domain-containing protein [Bifidobacteriaceae bacterium]|jgi:ATPase subunit of ABC transporter with duplicated ATPase domains|nr:ABC-F family ATP-binding cassette domain-containing protein [Bifidobacteriaceae bacterium]
MHLLGAEALTIAYQGRAIIDGASLGIESGDRIGIVGRNGDGKTTLLELLAGRRQPDLGRVTHRGGLSVGFLPQSGLSITTPPTTAQPSTSAAPRTTVGSVIVGEGPEHEWATQGRIRAILAGLVGDLDLTTPLESLSGGQRRRVALAGVLAGDHDVLLLDEPTNHLDMEAIAWLADHLGTRWPPTVGALAVVTHDRWFLDAVCTSTWEVHDGRVEPFDGGYASYVLARVERDRQAAAAEARRRGIMRKELAWLRRGAPARTSKPRFRLDAAAALIAAEPPPRDSVELTRLATARLGKDVIDVVDMSAAYDDGPPVLHDVTWLIGPGERSGILGANGAGKSTLLAVIAGRLPPVGGRVKIGKTVRVATLAQEGAELDLVGDLCADEVIAGHKAAYQAGQSLGWTGGGRDATATRAGDEFTPGHILERLGFATEHMRTPIARLSGGQRRRLQLALVLMAEPNVLILDEPSNDLDTDMLAAMEDLLDSWPGTLLVVTHDRYLMERVTDQQYAIVDGHLRMVPGGVEEYLDLVAGVGAADGAAERPDSAGARVWAARKEVNAIERKLTKLRTQVANLHAAMACHDQADYLGIAKLAEDAGAVQAQIDAAEDRWFELAEHVDEA